MTTMSATSSAAAGIRQACVPPALSRALGLEKEAPSLFRPTPHWEEIYPALLNSHVEGAGTIGAFAHHPQVAQCEQVLSLGCVLGQSAIAHFDESELMLDDPRCDHFHPLPGEFLPRERLESLRVPAAAAAVQRYPDRVAREFADSRDHVRGGC